MRVSCWKIGHTKQYSIRIDCIRENVRMTPIIGKIIEYHLWWFGHVWIYVETPLRRVDRIKGSSIIRGKGRSRKTLGKIIKKDLDLNGLPVDTVDARILC